MPDPILSASDPAAPPLVAVERRAAERFGAEALVSCRPLVLSQKETMAALLKDVSTQGVSLILRHRFEPGTMLVVDLSDLTGEPPTPLLARVVHVRAHGAGKWQHGCALQKELNERQLRSCRADVEPDSGTGVTHVAAADHW
jgi:hypothetical protein